MSLQDLLAAIECIHSSHSSAAQRSAYNTCEAFKANCDNLPLAGLELAKPTNSVVVRHFGCQLLDHFVKFKWSGTTDAEKAEFKNILVKNILEAGTLDILKESGLVKNILSAVTSEILKRDWPNNWVDFLNIVKANMSRDSTAGEILLSSLSRLIEDIELDSNLTPARRADLLRCVGVCKDEIIDMIACKLKEIIESPNNVNATQETPTHKTAVVALEVLSAASSMTWFQHNSLYDKKSHVCTLLFLLLRDNWLRQASADVLYNLAARKTSLADNSEFAKFMLQDDALKMLFDIASEICSSTLNDKSVLFLKTLCRTYTQLGENHISGIYRNHMSVNKESFQKYLQLMLIFYEHHLISIRSIVIDLWVHFMNVEQLKKNEDLRLVVPHVVRATQKYFCRPLLDDPFDDFLDYSELMKIYSTQLSKMISLIGHAAKICPNETLQVAFEWQMSILRSDIPKNVLCKEDTKPFTVWKYFATFVEKIISFVFKHPNPEVKIEPIQQSLGYLLKFDCSDPLISYWHVSSISAYVPTFRDCDSLTIPMLEKLFILLGKKFENTYAGVSNAKMSALVSDLHRHTSSCLLKFVTNYPAAITWEVFQEMQALYTTLLASIDNQRYGSMLLILEALIAGSNKIPNLDQQIGYIKQLIKPLLTLLDSPDIKRCVDFASFLQFMKIDPNNCSEVSVEVKQLRLGLAALCAVSKRFTNTANSQPPSPAFQMVFPYLETVFTLNKAINKFWCSETYNEYPWLKVPLEPDKETKMIYCTLLDKRTDAVPTFRMNMVGLTDYANQLIESICQNLHTSIYKWESFSNLIMDCYVIPMQTVQMPRLKAILHSVVKPFLVYCPLEDYGICLNVLQVTLETVYKRLSAEWSDIQARKLVVNAEEYAESSAELDEIFYDHMVLIVTREYCDLLTHFFSRKSREQRIEGRRKSDGGKLVNPVTEHLLKSSQVSVPLLVSVFSCMSWGDGVSSNRACSMAHTALKLIESSGVNLSTEATHTFIVKSLQALQIHGQHDNCLYTLLNVIIAIIQNTYKTMPNVTKDILAQIPNVIPEKIERFFNTLEKSVASDRNLRDSLQSVVNPIISRPVSEAGKQHYKIHELKPIIFKSNSNNDNSNNNLSNNELEGLHSLFTQGR